MSVSPLAGTVDEVREGVTVDDVMEQLDIVVPSDRKLNCPVHADDTASLHLYETYAHCYGCGFHGDVIDVLRAFTGATWGQAIQWLSGIVPADLAPENAHKPKQKPIPKDLSADFLREPPGSPADFEAAERLIASKWPCLSLKDLQGYGVAVKRYQLWIPHWRELAMVGIKTRSLTPGSKKDKSSLPGSVFTTGLYSVQPEDRFDSRRWTLIVEGESDTWVATKVAGAVADVYGMPSGASTWHEDWLSAVPNTQPVFVATDPDPAGEKAAERILASCEKRKLYAVRLLPPDGDVADSVKAGWDPRTALSRRS